ncbi:MAG TPA: hypothetical protein VFC99_06620 [Acidimicrobiia bacterium]|nr:hypothetical protein [Acidimicrobiia bacterium]
MSERRGAGEFLTPGWVAELDAAARESPGLRALGAGPPFTVELQVGAAGNGAGEFVFQAAFGGGATRFTVGSPGVPDLVVRIDAGFAARIHAGTANVQDALLAGALKVRGDLDGLVERASALAAVGTVLGARPAG